MAVGLAPGWQRPGTLFFFFKARTSRLRAADSPSPAQTGRRDKASRSASPPSSGPLFPPPPQEGRTPALAFKPTQHGAGPQGACAGTGYEVGRIKLQPSAIFKKDAISTMVCFSEDTLAFHLNTCILVHAMLHHQVNRDGDLLQDLESSINGH